jgi:hypothetical protein
MSCIGRDDAGFARVDDARFPPLDFERHPTVRYEEKLLRSRMQVLGRRGARPKVGNDRDGLLHVLALALEILVQDSSTQPKSVTVTSSIMPSIGRSFVS